MYSVVRAGAVTNSRIPVLNDEGIPAVNEAESPVVRRGSAARGVCDKAVAEEPGPSRVPALVIPACLACWHAWFLLWRPVPGALAKKTVAPSRHPHVRPVKLSERQTEHVGHVPPRCGQTGALCGSLGRRISIRRSLVDKELRRSRLEEVPAEAEAGRSPQSGRDGTTDTGSYL
ncbi:hypothetical protein TcG_11910 [Trypanosoma cruzi]|nr:hypothetical protein TcG_11910 [Trypanosoma cruzi]